MPALEQTVPLSIKSSTTYVTPSEHTVYLRVAWGAYAAFLIGAMSVVSLKKWPIR